MFSFLGYGESFENRRTTVADINCLCFRPGHLFQSNRNQMKKETKVQWLCVIDGNISHADNVHAYPKQKVLDSWIA